MITITKIGKDINGKILELYGLSTDTKPTDVVDGVKIINASMFYCMDTQSVYLYDEQNRKWIAQE